MTKKVLGQPKPDSAVLNSEPSILLVGYGWVGQQCGKYFPQADIYDLDGLRDKDGYPINEFRRWQMAIISVPTPMNPNGSGDTSVVEDMVARWKDRVDLFMIKSTVAVGTTNYLRERYGVRIVFSPEYLGETLGHPHLEARRDIFLIIGGTKADRELAARYWKRVLHANFKLYLTEAKTAELCKYMENSFLALKVAFCAQFFLIAERLGVNYDQLRELWLADPRINRSHTLVYEDNLGFSGKCLPKDVNAIVATARENGIETNLLEAILLFNANVLRKDYTHDLTPLLPQRGES